MLKEVLMEMARSLWNAERCCDGENFVLWFSGAGCMKPTHLAVLLSEIDE